VCVGGGGVGREAVTILNASTSHDSRFGMMTGDVAAFGWPVWSRHLF
jgi:hypothetical protein